MDIFFLLFQNLIPLYVVIGVGYLAGRLLHVDIKSMSALAIYVFMPIAVFGYVAQLEFKPVYIGSPILMFGTLTLLAFSWKFIASKIYPDNRVVLLTMCTTWGNCGYFAIPLIIALFPPQQVGIYFFLFMGNILYEATVGYYIWMRGNLSIKDSIKKVLTFPSFYGLIFGLAVNFSGHGFSDQVATYWEYCKGAYLLLGMMIIGTALSKMPKLVIAPRFLSLAFLGKFIIWPAFAFAFIMLDKHVLGIFDTVTHQMFFLASTVPPGANIAAFAAQLDMRPGKAATTVIIGTVIALFTVPLTLALSGLF
jgi:hypothetical protein